MTIAYSADSGSKPFPLYGGPLNEPTSDSLDLAGLKFTAASSNGSSPDSTVCDLTVTLTANAGKVIKNFNWTEGGVFDVSQQTGTGNNSASVYPQTFRISVLAVNGTTLPTPLTNSTVTLNFPNGNFFQTSDPGSDTGTWLGTAQVDLQSLFHISGITKLSIAYENLFSADSVAGGTGTITKQYVNVAPTLSAVPEPAALCVMAIGSLVMLRRRK